MLSLRDIVKTYTTGDSSVTALRGVSVDFRESEFVSILGPSGCGKTTLLNVIGGLDRYDSGDLVINGRSTKEYRDADWDTYRNHSVGFVFQSYNLIMHQTVLSNVELALTLSGVSREERRRRAIEALEQVGLGDQIHKKPNQMSGGQMQRVAIARALVNDPDILLADEPTGALDTATSVQIMEILKKVSERKLVVMVTHNPELAEQYSTRIIRLLDGEVQSDSNPFDAATAEVAAPVEITPVAEVATDIETEQPKKMAKKKSKKTKNAKGKRSMSFTTALSLSFNNLLTKKARTLLVSVAGSIGIIGIALILALSNGVNLFIANVQENTLSSYPLTIQRETQDTAALLSAMTSVSTTEDYSNSNKIYVDDSLGTMMAAMSSTVQNDLEAFKKYIEEHGDELDPYVNDIRYTYDFDLQIFTADGKTQINPTAIFKSMGSDFASLGNLMESSGMGSMSILSEMIDNQELLDQQYELVGEGSHWPTKANEVVLVISGNNQISKMTLYMLGVLDQGEIEGIMTDLMTTGKYDADPIEPYEFSDFIGMSFKLLNTSDFYEKTGKNYTVNGKEYPLWYDVREAGFDQEGFVTENGTDLVISGIVRPKKGSTATSISGALGYTKELTNYILQKNAESEIIAQQKATPHNSVLTGGSFERIPYTRQNIQDLIDRVGTANMERFYGIMTMMILQTPEYKGLLNVTGDTIAMFLGTMDSDAQAARIKGMLANAAANDYIVQPAMPPHIPTDITALGMLFSAIKRVPGGLGSIDFTKDNLVDLLPLMSETQIMLLVNGMPATETTPAIPAVKGLKDICSAEYMTTVYAEMNADMVNWQINEKTMLLLLGSEQMSDEMFAEFESTLYDMVPDKDETYDSILRKLGDAEKAKPESINFYAVDFESKERIEGFIADYNDTLPEEKQLKYSDIVGNMMSSVTIIVDAISYVLIAFVSISLVVSSIMIGIITYISVLERTKEIGILRAIGASKRDISRVFNAETLIIGLAAGVIGILFTVLACIPITLILRAVTGISILTAVLPFGGAVLLILISMVLTLIAGIIPSRIASKKDPVEALRSE